VVSSFDNSGVAQPLVVGAQYMLPFAREVALYAAEPKNREAAAFDAPLSALASVAGKIGAAGDCVAQEEREKVGDDIPLNARRPERRHHFACCTGVQLRP
jgi:hypothetical protein